MIVNQIANHTREIILALRTEYLDVPDHLSGLLDSFARYKTGAMGLGVSIAVLTRAGRARYYRGLDEEQALEKDEEVLRHFAYFSDMSYPVVLDGPTLSRTTGMRTAQLVDQNFHLGHMSKDDRLMLLNAFKTAYEAGASACQSRKVSGLHGHYVNLEDDNEELAAPESLEDLFNPVGEWHGVAPNGLGSWLETHPFGRDGDGIVGNHPNNNGDNKFKHVPQTVDTVVDAYNTYTSNTDEAYGAEIADLSDLAGATTPLKYLDRILRKFTMCVRRTKLGYCSSDVMTEIVAEILNKNLTIPSITMGGYGWEYDIDCVNIAGTKIIADPNSEPGTLRVMEVGDPNMNNGTVFPFYWDPDGNPATEIRQLAKAKSDMMGRPKALDFGQVRETPYYSDEWGRNHRYNDVVSSKIRLSGAPIICTVRGNQLGLNRLDELFDALAA